MNAFFQSVYDLAPWIAVDILIIAIFVTAWVRIFAERCNNEVQFWKARAEWKDSEIAKEIERERSAVRQEMQVIVDDYRRQAALCEQGFARLQQENGALYSRYTAIEERFAELTTFISDIDSQFVASYRRQWLAYISQATFGTLDEIAYKLALPLILFLGYDLESIRIGGVRRIFGVAPQARTSEWVISGRRSGQVRIPLFLVQLVETSETLTDDFLEQTGLIASTEHVYDYIVTNGHNFYLCRRNTPVDIPVVDCSLRDFWQRWEDVAGILAIDALLPP